MLRIDRRWRRLVSQDTARTNAAEASAQLRIRRHEQEDVDAYLEALRGTHRTTGHAARPQGSPTSAYDTSATADTR
jgi:hypothetical protein